MGPENHRGMRRLLALSFVAALALGAAPAGGAQRPEDGRLFVGATTPLTAGYFFPGTGISDGNTYSYPEPLEIEQGANVVVTNVDEEAVANNHAIQSLKSKRVGKKGNRRRQPLFGSKALRHPGDSVTMVTSHLRPGLYKYRCTTHAGMYGAIQVVRAGA
jgi:plastocyanin